MVLFTQLAQVLWIGMDTDLRIQSCPLVTCLRSCFKDDGYCLKA